MAYQIISEVNGHGDIKITDLEKASKDGLEALLTAILEMKLKHKAEMMAVVEDSKISEKTKHI